MRSTTTLLLAFVFLSTNSFVDAQPAGFALAERFMIAQQFEDACLEYEYIIYQHPEDRPLMAECLLKKTECLKAANRYNEIPALLSRLDGFSLNDSLKSRIYFQKALGYYMSDRFEQAEKSIRPLFNLNVEDEELAMNGAFLYAMTLGENGKWTEAKSFLLQFIAGNNRIDAGLKTTLSARIEELYHEKNIPRLKSIRKSKTLSLLFPGLGQAYNGNYGKGFVSLLLVSGSGTWIGWNIINTTYLTAATAGVYIFLYFYFGGANQSSWLVPLKNYKKKSQYNQSMRTELGKISRQCLVKTGK